MDENLSTDDSSMAQFITFVIGSEHFALPLEYVREIIRISEMVRVPLSSPCLEGLASLRGKILPVINTRGLFKLAKIEHGEQARVIVVDIGVALGFVVDRVSSVISVETSQIAEINALEATIESHLLAGMIKNANGTGMTMILDVRQLIGGEFKQIAEDAAKRNAKSVTQEEQKIEKNGDTKADDELHLISFLVAEQEYAFKMENVQEILQVPASFCKIPKAQEWVIGVMSLRNRLLPVVGMRQLFGFPAAELTENNRIVVVSADGSEANSVGIVMDDVKEVLRLHRHQMDELPAVVSQGNEGRQLEAICRLDEGKRLVSIVSVESLFKTEALHHAVKETQKHAATNSSLTTTAAQSDSDEQTVVFKIGAEEFGVKVEVVQEILRLPEQFTHVPKALTFVEGLVSLRGHVLPVIDLRRRFGLATKERDDRQRILVFMLDGIKTGVIVDAVLEVLMIPKRAIEVAPVLSLEQGRMIKRVANLEDLKRMIVILEIDQLLEQQELAQLKQNAA